MEFCILRYLIIFEKILMFRRKNCLEMGSITYIYRNVKHEIRFHRYNMHLRHEVFP